MAPDVRAVVPAELRKLDQWVCWSHEGGTKIPKVAGAARRASSTDPTTWRTFEECVEAVEAYPRRYAGVGFVFTKNDPYAGADLDDVRNAETGALTDRAAQIVALLDGYAEVSPSGTGVKIWVRASLVRAKKKVGVEVYAHGRYFAVTGMALPRSPLSVGERQAVLEALIREEFPESERETARSDSGPPPEKTDLSELLVAGGVQILREIPDGTAETVYGVVCPWSREHSGGDTSGTRVGQYADGALFFCCEHAHCAHRGWAHFRSEVAPLSARRLGFIPTASPSSARAGRSGVIRVG